MTGDLPTRPLTRHQSEQAEMLLAADDHTRRVRDTATGLHMVACTVCGGHDYTPAPPSDGADCEACGAAGAWWHAEDCTCQPTAGS